MSKYFILFVLFICILFIILKNTNIKNKRYEGFVPPDLFALPYDFTKDTEFIKPIRNNKKFYEIKKELSPKKIESILDEIKKENLISPEKRKTLNLVKSNLPKSSL